MATMGLDQVLAHHQPQSDAAVATALQPGEWLEQLLLVFGFDAYPVVAYADEQAVFFPPAEDLDLAAFGRIFYRVLQQVIDDLLDSGGVTRYLRGFLRDFQDNVTGIVFVNDLMLGFVSDIGYPARSLFQLQATGLVPGQLQHVFQYGGH